MKKSITLGIIVALGLVGLIMSRNLNTKATIETGANKVAATIFPIYDIVREIGGDEFEVVLMLPSGASPHTFDPQPSLLKDLQGSQAVFAIGHGLDNWATVVAKSIKAPIVSVDHGIDLRATEEGHEEHDEEESHQDNAKHQDEDHADHHDEGDEHEEHEEYDEEGDTHEDNHDNKDADDHGEEDHDEHGHGPIDPHYWLSLHNAEQITMNIAKELSELDAENAGLYTIRAEAYIEKIEVLEKELIQKTASLTGKNIISLHDAWYYFAEDFNLNLVGTFEPSAGKEPTPQYIVNLKNEVDEHNVSVLFMEPQLSQSSIKSFVNDNDLKIAIIDPLGGVEGRDNYLDLMRYNVDQVVDALAQ